MVIMFDNRKYDVSIIQSMFVSFRTWVHLSKIEGNDLFIYSHDKKCEDVYLCVFDGKSYDCKLYKQSRPVLPTYMWGGEVRSALPHGASYYITGRK